MHLKGHPSSSTAKDYARVTWSFTQTLFKKLPDAVDPNPVKMAFGIVKIILPQYQSCVPSLQNFNGRVVITRFSGSQLFSF